jgi:hypothetical protein
MVPQDDPHAFAEDLQLPQLTRINSLSKQQKVPEVPDLPLETERIGKHTTTIRIDEISISSLLKRYAAWQVLSQLVVAIIGKVSLYFALQFFGPAAFAANIVYGSYLQIFTQFSAVMAQ